MKINEGRTDRILRVLFGIILMAKGIFIFDPGWVNWLVIVIGAILVITGIIGFCSLYALFHMNTNKR